MELEWIPLPSFADERGTLLVMEEGLLPFSIKRVYTISGVPAGAARGGHAHQIQQGLAVCLRGSCTFLLDDGAERRQAVLNTPNSALRLRSRIWIEMFDFSADCILAVLSSEQYDKSDYIREYSSFLALLAKKPYTEETS